MKSGLCARSSSVTLRGNAILPSFGFGRLDHLLRRERLENEPHFLRLRSFHMVKTIQTKSASFRSPYPKVNSSQDVGYNGAVFWGGLGCVRFRLGSSFVLRGNARSCQDEGGFGIKKNGRFSAS